MTPQQLEKWTRLAVLSVVGLMAAAIGNKVYHASNLCLADMTWRDPEHYKLVALRVAREFEVEVLPPIPPAASDESLLAYLRANPECCLMGKQGWSEHERLGTWDRLLGRATKTVSLNSGLISGSTPPMIGYNYVLMNNCGENYRRER
ncbi:hypothetical protein D3C72_1718100 [compost metagenome]